MVLFIFALLLAGSAAAGFGVTALLRRRGVPARPALISGLAAGAAGGVALFLYGFEAFAYALNDTGPDIHDFSPYVEYHELGGWAELALIAAYALIPLVLVAGGMLAGAYRRRPVGIALCVLGGLAVLLQIQDVTFALNDKGVTPREDPGDLPEIGLEVERHRWYPGEPPLP